MEMVENRIVMICVCVCVDERVMWRAVIGCYWLSVRVKSEV